ncbi:peptidoglycan DD-metalloendopeptidase family protein [Pseudanabaenaceae cyanobacterium LEGE 13415]|nr:peptidoglycan DD-metalloendopeptidase family protein [Pseudanabaenaceae cyanobacterium LEGE 13415]
MFNFVSNTWNGVFKGIRDAIAWIGNNSLKWLQDRFGGVFKFLQDRLGDLQKLFGGGGNTSGGSNGGVKKNADTYSLATVAILEAGGGDKQGQIDVSQAIANRVASNFSGFGKSYRDQIYASGQFAPFEGLAKGSTDNEAGAIDILSRKLGISKTAAKKLLDEYFAALADDGKVKSAQSFVGNRTDFKGTTMQKYRVPSEDPMRNSNSNFFHYTEGTKPSQWKQGNLEDLQAPSIQNSVAGVGNYVANAVNTSGFQLWTTGGGSRQYTGTLRPHHNMSGAYNTSDPTVTKNSLGQGVYDMTLVTSSGSDAAPIPSPVSGRVTFAGIKGGYGNTVMINTGSEEVLLAHLRSIGVKVGQNVTFGQKIGVQGGTGSGGAQAYAVHLHLEATPSVAKRYADAIKNNRFGVASKGGGGNRPEVAFDESKYTDRTDSSVVASRSIQGTVSNVVSGGTGGGGAPQLGTFMRLTRTGKTDSIGLELLKLDLVDRATGRVLDSVMTNSGTAATQNFSRDASLNGRDGSKLPIPIGTYGIGDVFQSNNPGINGAFLELEGKGINQKDRSAFGIHLDADRLTKAGSSGCIVVFDTADRSKVLDWVQGRNAPTQLKVDYSVPKTATTKPVTIPASNVKVQVGTSGVTRPITSTPTRTPDAALAKSQTDYSRANTEYNRLLASLTPRERTIANEIEAALNAAIAAKRRGDSAGYNREILRFDQLLARSNGQIYTVGAASKLESLAKRRASLRTAIVDREAKLKAKPSATIPGIQPLPAGSIELTRPANNIVPKPSSGVKLTDNETLLLTGASAAMKKLYEKVELQRVQLSKLKSNTAEYQTTVDQYNKDIALLPLSLQDAQRSQSTATQNLLSLTKLVPGISALPLDLPLNSLEQIEKQQDLDKQATDIKEQNQKLSDRRKQLATVQVEFDKVRATEKAVIASLTERERQAYAAIEQQRIIIDRMRTGTAAEQKKVAEAKAAYEANVQNLNKIILTPGAGTKLADIQKDKDKTNDALLAAQLDVKEQSDSNSKAERDRELELKKKRLQEAGDEFNLLKRYLEARGIGATDTQLIQILTLADTIEQQEAAIKPSSLKEGTRKALARLGILQGGSFDASKLGGLGGSFFGANPLNIKSKSTGTDVGALVRSLYNSRAQDSQLSVYKQLYESGTLLSGFERFPNMTAADIQKNMTFAPPVSSGGGSSPTKRVEVRYIEDGAGNRFVKQEDFERFSNTMTDYLNSPFMVDNLADSVVDRIRYDAVTRRRLGF